MSNCCAAPTVAELAISARAAPAVTYWLFDRRPQGHAPVGGAPVSTVNASTSNRLPAPPLNTRYSEVDPAGSAGQVAVTRS